jgi:hypothetical protein
VEGAAAPPACFVPSAVVALSRGFVRNGAVAGIVAGLALLLGAADAGAIPIVYELRLVSSSPVPANGALVFVSDSGTAANSIPSVVVQGPSGSVAGALTMVAELVVWTPAEELPVGEYTVEVLCGNLNPCIEMGPIPFQVVEMRVTEAPSATCSLTFAPTTGYGQDEICCGQRPDSTASGPHCFASTLNTHHVGLAGWGCAVDPAGAAAEQILYRITEAPSEAPPPSAIDGLILVPHFWQVSFTPLDASGVVEVRVEPPALLADGPEYCLEIELMDTRTGVPSRARHCEPDPGWEPVEVPMGDPDARLLGLPACEVPPAGLEDRWCELNRSTFYDECATPEVSTEPVAPMCTPYGLMCEVSPEELEARWCEQKRSAFDADCVAPVAPTDPVASFCTTYYESCEGQSPWPPPLVDDPGCACRLTAPPGRDRPGSRWGSLALLALFGLGGARRARRLRSPPRASGGARALDREPAPRSPP